MTVTTTVERSRPGQSRAGRSLSWLLLAVVVAGLMWAGFWRLNGGHWERVETASMGTVAPVGTLLWVEPVKFSSLKVGDFITFHPPNSSTTYSHRVYAINPDGTISTKGVIPAPDPWKLTANDVVGKVEMRWWGVGWLVKAAPLLIVGALLVWFTIRRFATHRWRRPLAIVGTALLLSIAIFVYRPLTRSEQLAFAPKHTGGQATYVSTGLLPLRLKASGGAHVDLRDGQVGSVLSTHADAQGKYPVRLTPHIPFWWWIVLVLACFVPAGWTVVFGSLPQAPPKHRAESTA